MPSNIINLNVEQEAHEHPCKLTPKQEMTIRLRNDYNKKACLRRAIEFHKVAYKHRVKEYVEIAERIELQEEILLDYEYSRILKREFYV
tara:strand:- start:741 stop:1007 length:267 start_codon:yes stop_codon:yes gene_type:complete